MTATFIGCSHPESGAHVGSVERNRVEPAPLRMVLGSQALEGTLSTLRKRIASFEAQTQLAASTDFPSGE